MRETVFLRIVVAYACWSCLAISEVHAQGTSPNATTRIAVNAGTGPYSLALQSGVVGGVKSVAFRFDQDVYRLIVAVEEALADWTPPRSNSNGKLLEKLGDLNKLLKEAKKSPYPERAKVVAEFFATLSRRATFDKDKAQRFFVSFRFEVVAHARKLRAEDKALAAKVGVYSDRSATYQFQTVTYSLGESGKPAKRHAYFLTGSELIRIGRRSASVTGRIGAGVIFGNPDIAIGHVSASTYLSPNAPDVEAGVTARVVTGASAAGSSNPGNFDDVIKAPSLINSIQPGDVWISGSGRYIAKSKSAALTGGTVGEGKLTYALPARSGPEKQEATPPTPTTISLSGIYCRDRGLGIDELGAEVRTPLRMRPSEARPVYLSFRYGTRGSLTFAVEWRF